MSEEHEFEFDTKIMPAENRDEPITRCVSDSAPARNGTSGTTPLPPTGSGNGIVAALQTKFDAEAIAERPYDGPQLLLLGAALYRYDVWSLPALLEHAEADPDPPTEIKSVLPFVRQLVERCDFD